MSTIKQSLKVATTVVSLGKNEGNYSIEDWPKNAILKLKSNNLSDRDELHRLNLQLRSYLDNVKSLEALNKSLIVQVERAKELAKPKLMDKGSLDEKINMVRLKLEDDSAECVDFQTRIEESESLSRHLSLRLQFFNNEAEVNRQKINSLENYLNEMNNQHDYLIRNATLIEEDLAREQAKQFKIEHDLDDLRAKLKGDKLKNKKIEFEMQTILDQLEFCKAVFTEEVTDFRDKLNGGTILNGLDLTNFYKNELITAVHQIRQDFHDLNNQQLDEFRMHKEAELAYMVHQNEKDKAHELELLAKNEYELKNSGQLRGIADQNKNELNQLNARNKELNEKLASLEIMLHNTKSKNSELLDQKQAEIDSLAEQNRSLSTELDYWERVTRAKLESEIFTYRCILNSQIKSIQFNQADFETDANIPKLNKRGLSKEMAEAKLSQEGPKFTQIGLSKEMAEAKLSQEGPKFTQKGLSKEMAEAKLSQEGPKFNQRGLSQEKAQAISTMKQVFDYFDVDGNQRINSSELEKVLSRLNINLSKEAYDQILKEADADLSRDLDFNEFCKIMVPVYTGTFDDDELFYAFKKFDLDNSGYITRDELKQILSKVGQHYTEQQIANMISTVDTDRDGKLNFEEFSKLMKPSSKKRQTRVK